MRIHPRTMSIINRGFAHGVPFEQAELRKLLDKAEWEDDDEGNDEQVRRVWLGTIFGITPSGKVYAPFACSNVAGDCPVCNGEGSREPRTGRRIRRRAKARDFAFSHGTCRRGFAHKCPAYVARVKRARDAAHKASNLSCAACDGNGSISAARDTRYQESLELLANSIDASISHYEDSIFVVEYRDKVNAEECDE